MQSLWKTLLVAFAGVGLAATPASASDVRDNARLFSDAAVKQSTDQLERMERETGVPARIETIDSLKGQPLNRVFEQQARRWGKQGVFVLIAKAEKKIEARDFLRFLDKSRRDAIHAAFASGEQRGGLDQGLAQLTESIGKEVRAAGPPAAQRPSNAPKLGRDGRVVRPNPKAAAPQASSGMPILIILGFVIVGVLVLGRLFARNRNYTPPYGSNMPGGPAGPGGMQPGYGPGYGAPGRGGFWSSVLGGLGGAMAGNWIYDQMSGRHHHDPYAGGNMSGDPGAAGPPPDDGTWGGDTGGASWGGDAGGGGDWGGGGGDFGGGDWGGGGDGGW